MKDPGHEPSKPDVSMAKAFGDVPIVAIVKRNAQGKLGLSEEVKLDSGDDLTLIPVPTGMVAVIGQLNEEDYAVFEDLLKDL